MTTTLHPDAERPDADQAVGQAFDALGGAPGAVSMFFMGVRVGHDALNVQTPIKLQF